MASSSGENTQVLLASHRNSGNIQETDFKVVKTTAPSADALKEGEVLIKVLYLCLEPYMRGRMSQTKSYSPGWELGKPCGGNAAGEVLESKSSKYTKGQIVTGQLGWQQYIIMADTQLFPCAVPKEHAAMALNVLGVAGLTAYFGLLDVGQPKPGDVLVVSSASGAVGMAVGQIGKIKGCKVIGLTSTDEKSQYLKEEAGFDIVINYQKTPNLAEALKEACPEGINIYFDNVGGDISDTVVMQCATFARVIICGAIAEYNLEKAEPGVRLYRKFIVSRMKMQGILLVDYLHKAPEAIGQLMLWMKEGKLKHREHIVDGLENAPKALIGLFQNVNFGKLIIKV